MPRKPTGRPRGRPAGTGQLDNPKRITVWLKGETYDKLESYADGRHYHRGEPQLASCIRELLEHALACPYKHQIQNIPVLHGDSNRPIENVPPGGVNNYEQIETITAVPENNYYEQIQIVPLVTENISSQIENIPEVIERNNGQIENVPATAQPALARDERPTFDPTRHHLGKLCPRNHAWGNTGQSLRNTHGGCLACDAEDKRARDEKKRQAASADKVDKAALVARLQQMHADEMNFQQIADQLNTEGLSTLSGRGQWARGTVAKLLAVKSS